MLMLLLVSSRHSKFWQQRMDRVKGLLHWCFLVGELDHLLDWGTTDGGSLDNWEGRRSQYLINRYLFTLLLETVFELDQVALDRLHRQLELHIFLDRRHFNGQICFGVLLSLWLPRPRQINAWLVVIKLVVERVGRALIFSQHGRIAGVVDQLAATRRTLLLLRKQVLLLHWLRVSCNVHLALNPKMIER